MKQTKYRIGVAARPVGLKGEFAVHPDTYNIDRYFELVCLFIGPSEHHSTKYTVEHVRLQGKQPIIKIAGIDSRNDAEKITGKFLFVDEHNRIDLPKGKHFIHDLIGLTAVDERGDYLGIVKDVLTMPAHPVYVIQNNTGEHMIPARDEFVVKVDVEGGKIVIRSIEGLID